MTESMFLKECIRLHEYILCNVRYFLDANVRFQAKLCKNCHLLMTKTLIGIIFVNSKIYKIHIFGMRKDEIVSRLKETDLTE